MNALERFYKELDKSEWDVGNESDINRLLQEVNKELFDANLLKDQPVILPVSDLPSGIYSVKILDANRKTYSARFVKN